jgi:E3 ubiquitin-protein ligase synoviolin
MDNPLIFNKTLIFRSWFQRQQTCPTCRLNILRTPITATQPPPPAQPPRPNEAPAPAPQPNPFLNLLGTQAAPAAAVSASLPVPPQGAPIPPPFFFPTLPFMAPYSIPPPPMPANLDQLTVEELRAMEGNERKHVEERLKLLKNVQTMLNASAALMNQYQMVMANLPPLPTAPVPPPAQAPEPSSSSTAEATTTENSQVRLEDIGSEENVVDSTTPSTSKLSTIDTTSTFIAEESLASSSANGESEEANEIRKRRLQKFAQSD